MNSKCSDFAFASRRYTAGILLIGLLTTFGTSASDAASLESPAPRALLIAQAPPEGGPPLFAGDEDGPPPPVIGPGAGPGDGDGPGAPGFRRGLRGGRPGGPGGGMRGLGGPGKGGGRFMGAGRRLDLTPLNLSEPQKTKIQALREQTRAQAKEVRKSLFIKQMKMRDLLFSADATDAQIMAARRELRDLQDKMDEINVKDMLAIRGVLTPEQKSKLPQLMPGRRDVAGGEGVHPGEPPPPGGPGGPQAGGPPPGAGSVGAANHKFIEMRTKAKVAGQKPVNQD